MKLNIIALPERKDRYEMLMKELERQGVSDWVIWPGIRNPENTTSENIAAAHKQIVLDAKSKGLPKVTIAEDDVFFPAKDGWDYYLKNMPNTFDLYLGGVYRGIENLMTGFSGLHLYTVAEPFYDQFLLANGSEGLDNALSGLIRHGKCKAEICYPIAAIQNETPSDNFPNYINVNRYFFNKLNTYGY